MQNKCYIPRTDINSSPTSEELISFTNDVIFPIFYEIINNPDYYNKHDVLSPTKSRLASIAAIQSLGKSIYESDHKYVVQAINDFINDDLFSFVKDIIPQGSLLNIMKSNESVEEISKEIFTDRIMDDEYENDAVDYFIHAAYGAATSAKKQLELKMNKIILNSFIVNREEGKIIQNMNQANHNIEVYKKELLQEIQDYYKSISSEKESEFVKLDLNTKTSKEIIDTFSRYIAKDLQVGIINDTELQSLYENGYDQNIKNDRLKINAYGAWLALQYFDNFVEMTLGDTIKINPLSKDRYTFSTKGTNVNKTWRKDDNFDLYKEINKLTQALINTSPFFKLGSNTPVENSYLELGNFSYITGKIKDLVYDNTASEKFIDEINNIYEQLSDYEKTLVKNKSFRQIISNCRLNPQAYTPLIYKILLSKTSETGYFMDNFKFNNQDKNLIWSIYKNIYEYSDVPVSQKFYSLYDIQKKEKNSEKNIYGAISSVSDCIFSVNFVHYTFDNGVLKLRTLRDAAVDKTRREIENIINTKNSSELIKNFNFDKYDIKILDSKNIQTDDKKNLKGITFKINLNNNINNPDYLYIHVMNMGEKIEFSKNNIPGKRQSINLSSLENNENILDFFDEVLGLNIKYNIEFKNTFKELVKINSDDNGSFVKKLLELSSHVFFNRYFSYTCIPSNLNKYEKLNIVNRYFKQDNKPKFNNTFFNIDVIPKNKYNTILNLAQALGTTRGINSSRQVKDSDNAMLSSQTLSRLLGNMIQQFDIQINGYNKLRELELKLAEVNLQIEKDSKDPNVTEDGLTKLKNDKIKLEQDILDFKDSFTLLDTIQNPAASHFDIITNPKLFKGILKSEEIKGLYENKKQVKFTTAEAVISSFLHNFVLGHCDKKFLDNNSELGDGIVGLLPSVNSDKTTVSIAKFDLNQKNKKFNKKYIDLTNEELTEVIQEEIGKFYTVMYNNVKEDFIKLTEWAKHNNKLSIDINPDDNFKIFNEWSERNNIKPSHYLFNLVNDYNKSHPKNPIRLIDQIHYDISKSTGRIKFNNTIKFLKNRFSNINDTKNFFNLKHTEVLKSALDSNFEINIYGNKSLDDQPEILYLRNKSFKEWIDKSGKMIIGKVNINGNIYNIANKNDLKILEEILGVDNLIDNIHLLKDMLQLHPMLEKYNLMDYLFTQQIMYSSVGSHVAHPAKSKNKTPIIWAHPAIGKTQLILDQKYSDKIMDWDEEFNGIRDEFISNHSGIPILDEEFKKIKTHYQLNWKNIPDFEKFVKTQWEIIKQKANEENKILVASPHMLLQMFPSEFDSILTMSSDEFINRNVNRGYTEENSLLWKEGIDKSINILQQNDLFKNKIKIIKDNEYLTTLIETGQLNKELNQLLDNEMAEEASRFYAQHKRNVSFTAAMTQFQLNQIDGIPLWYNIAVIDDIEEGLFTIDGNTDSAKPYDGATFVNPFIMYLENNSLNESKAGIDKKQFVHYYDELTGTGGIIKTAGFALTNDRIRNSEFYRDMMHNMTNKIWRDYTGNYYITDITYSNYKNEVIDYGTFYYKKGSKYYRATIKKDAGDNNYIRESFEVNKEGAVISDQKKEEIFTVNTNYKLWQMFGGMNSQELINGVLIPSETSMELVTKAIINSGTIKPTYKGGDITAQHIDQPLKNADIHYMPTKGAVKQGIANINPNTYYKGKHDLNFFRIRMTNAGIQLDKEHHADDSKLSLMTQVISSACSMGLTQKQATNLYNALYNLTIQGIKPFKQSFSKLLKTPDSKEFENMIAECMIKNMLDSTSRDGDMLRAIATELMQKVRKGEPFSDEDTKLFPYSDPAVFDKLVSNLSVIMTKSGIKAEMDGILSVLCPTQEIVKLYNVVDENKISHTLTLSQLENKYAYLYDETDTDETFLNKVLEHIQSQQVPLFNDGQFDTNKISIGKKYKIKFKNRIDNSGREIKGYETIIDIKYPHDTGVLKGSDREIVGYKSFKNLLKNGHAVYGEIESVQEYVKDGTNLKSINFKFKDTTGKSYQIWDIDYIQDLFTIVKNTKKSNPEEKIKEYENLIIKYEGSLDKFEQAKLNLFKTYQNKGEFISTKHKLKLIQQYAKQLQQNILFSLSKNNPDKNIPVIIDDQPVEIDKNSIETESYEIVMPKIFLKEFGLDNYANLDEILNDENYFYNKIVNNFNTKVLDEIHYDLELKKVNGNHIYIKDKTDIQPGWDEDLEKVNIYTKTDELGQIWRYDLETNKKLYQLFSDKDEVYRIPGTDVEIILTSSKQIKNENEEFINISGINFYLDHFKYQSLHISEAIVAGKRDKITERPKFDDIFKMIQNSNNKCAKSWVKLFTGNTNKDIEEKKQGWTKDPIEFNKELNDISGLSIKLQKHLREQSKIIHTSFKKSLEIIAARIPAQNQQSFMPMKVVAFDNPNINTAYVSIMQFFLQGSDLDIDAVSLLTFSFNDNGEFYNWSPDFNMSNIDMLNLSMNIPFPSGESLKIINYATEKNPTNIADRKPLITDNIYYKALLEEELNKENSKQEFLTNEQKENQIKQSLENYIKLLEYINESNGVIYFNSEEDANSEFAKNLINRINNHNLYLIKSGDKTTRGAIKNYIVGSLRSISSDAANMLEAHTGVDIATTPLKTIANASPLSVIQQTFTPGNVFNKFQAIEEASVGKDDIAICATGLKAFFASTQFCNNFLNKKNIKSEEVLKEVFKIIKFNDVTIGGKTFNTLANIRFNDLTKIPFNEEIYQIFKNKGFEEDASVIMSALLSLSTDNAKELCLAKINAGTGMIGMYLYGASIGMDFEVMNKIIASPIGFTVAKLLNGNEFTSHKGKTSIDSALKYLTYGPKKGDLSKFNGSITIAGQNLSVFKLFEKSVKEILDDENSKEYLTNLESLRKNDKDLIKITINNIGNILAKYTQKFGKEESIKLLNTIREKANSKFSKYLKKSESKYYNFSALNNQMYDFLNEFIEQNSTLSNANYETEYGQSNIIDDLNKLSLGADEFKRLGQFLRLNQEIKTKSDELITFVQKIENCIVDRVKIIKGTNRRLGISNSKELDDLQEFDFKNFAESFISDPDNPNAYHNQQIELYEKYCKTCINPLRILTSVPHYKGYLTSMILAYEGDYIKSAKFRAIKHLGNPFIELANVSKASDKKMVYKGVKNFVDSYINNAYLKNQPFVKLPKYSEDLPVKIIDEYGNLHENDYNNTFLQLGTENDNRTFEYFFETVFIKELKKQFPNNKFVQDLTERLIIDPVTGIRYIATSLPINMMPSSDNEQILLDKYKNEFNKLEKTKLTIDGNQYSIIQMFQYYNLLKFNGKASQSSLLKIFEDVMNNNFLKSYRLFVNNFDETYDFALLGKKDNINSSKQIEEIDPLVLYKYLAPSANPFSTSADIIKYKDSVLGQTVLLQRKKEESEKSINLSDDNDYQDVFNDQMEQQYEDDFNVQDNIDLDDEYTNKKYTPNYSNFKLIAGVGILTRFNPSTFKIDNRFDKILDEYSFEENVVKNVIIKEGCVKQLIYNGTRVDLDSKIKVIKIIQEGDNIQYVIDEDELNSIIKTVKCNIKK